MEINDTRIYRVLYVGNDEVGASSEKNNTASIFVKPYLSRYTYAGDFFETPEAVQLSAATILENKIDDAEKTKLNDYTKKRVKELKLLRQDLSGMYTATMSMIHPYALIRLTGTNATDYNKKYNSNEGEGVEQWNEQHFKNETEHSNIYDSAKHLKWYEVDNKLSSLTPTYGNDIYGDVGMHYAKSPTTKDLINWSTYDKMGRFPYAFQDFVFCKYWNKIENNRLITLRRYPAPVLDNVIPANYKNKTNSKKGTRIYKSAFAPVATAVTYFGEGTDNSVKDLLNFTVGYNWSELTSDVHNTTSKQIEEGKIFGGGNTFLNTGLGTLSIMLGLMGDYSGQNTIGPDQIRGNPPDPYQNGPYENRVIGPVNVIMNVHKRERGLKFEQDSLVLTFDYVSRPIAHVNNKAILLDLLANILTMTYSSGTWFGGAHRYRVEHPSVYPWRDMSSLNKIYQGKLFGSDGAFMSIFRSFFNSKTENFMTNFASDIIEGVKSYAKDIVNAIKGGGDANSAETVEARKRRDLVVDKIAGTAGRAVAAHLMRGAQVPWLEGAKALLTGEPVGDWHITLGNPLNPIAMIGNLIVDNCEIEFYDELGPDDFPIGFKAKITLKHGMGRDKDAVESMFNRGNGRMYILSDAFKTSADHETKVDDYTGNANPNMDKIKVSNWGALQTTGSFGITKYKAGELSINGSQKMNVKIPYNPAKINAIRYTPDGTLVTNIFRTTPWAMHYIL